MTSVGLVLGAGGAVGVAWHAGVVAALAEATGWDARSADVVVGTSAGSIVAASLRAGLAPGDHHARATATALSPEAQQLLGELPLGDDVPEYPVRPAGLPVPAAPHLALAAVVGRSAPRPGLGVAGLLPRGAVPTDMIARGIARLGVGRWPERPTWICALDLRHGRRTVFGRDDVRTDVDLPEAVAASCAVPGLFAPVRIGRVDYVDGGAWSATNADLLAGIGLDLVIVVSPMSAVPGALRRDLSRVWRAVHGLRLRAEVDAVRRRGAEVLVVQPSGPDLPILGRNPMDVTRSGRVAEQARRSAMARLERADAAPAVDLLRRTADGSPA